MAKLKAHGTELDRREYPRYRVAVMSDGNIMRDCGAGWKLWKRVQAGIDVQVYAINTRAKYDARPAIFHEYVKTLQDAVSLAFRSELHELVSLLPSDPDGVWSEFNDHHMYSGADIDLDDCVKLCRIYQAATALLDEVAS